MCAWSVVPPRALFNRLYVPCSLGAGRARSSATPTQAGDRTGILQRLAVQAAQGREVRFQPFGGSRRIARFCTGLARRWPRKVSEGAAQSTVTRLPARNHRCDKSGSTMSSTAMAWVAQSARNGPTAAHDSHRRSFALLNHRRAMCTRGNIRCAAVKRRDRLRPPAPIARAGLRPLFKFDL